MSGMHTTGRLIGCFLLFVTAQFASANEADLYQAAVAVDERGPEKRHAAISAAMEQVVVKLTGSRAPGTLEQARELSAQAADLVQQYRYASRDNASADEPAWTLWVRFDPPAMQRALRDAGLPVWSGNRPAVLLWTGVDSQGRRRFMQAESDPQLAAAKAAVGDERGLLFVSPLLDLEDRGKLKPQDLWGGFDTPIRDASARYQSDLILVGRLSASGSSVLGEWRLLHKDQEESWRELGSNRRQALELGLSAAVDRLAQRYAPLSSSRASADLLVLVRGVNDLPAYLELEQFFGRLDGVQNLGPVRIESDQTLFRLQVEGGAEALQRAASLGRVLSAEPVGALGGPDLLAPDLVFRLQP